jgi:hypothetical protein
MPRKNTWRAVLVVALSLAFSAHTKANNKADQSRAWAATSLTRALRGLPALGFVAPVSRQANVDRGSGKGVRLANPQIPGRVSRER